MYDIRRDQDRALPPTTTTPRCLPRCSCWRRHPESNRGARICNPLRSHSAMAPEDAGRDPADASGRGGLDARRLDDQALLDGPGRDPHAADLAVDDATELLEVRLHHALGAA